MCVFVFLDSIIVVMWGGFYVCFLTERIVVPVDMDWCVGCNGGFDC